ncbi:unnamed protein product [marine sediment metagenome]|uniref:Uncharacterized protein n=1 Tax=marine sediment metagenome TaxID=412755 RepID=X1F8N9_9ZZZZ
MSARKATGSKRKKKKQWRKLTLAEKKKLFKGLYGEIEVWSKGKLVMKDGKLIGEEGQEWWKEWLSKPIRKEQPIGGEYD